MQYFSEMPYDVITTGNHELYKYHIALSTYENLAKHYGTRYITSNVNITLQSADGEGETVPAGARFAKFTTEQGRNVTALGPLFFFKGEPFPYFRGEKGELTSGFSPCYGHRCSAAEEIGRASCRERVS